MEREKPIISVNYAWTLIMLEGFLTFLSVSSSHMSAVENNRWATKDEEQDQRSGGRGWKRRWR